jgi:hypothetical protein
MISAFPMLVRVGISLVGGGVVEGIALSPT